MSVWLTQIIQLIASDTGSLTYRLVLAFSIAIALYLTLSMAPAQADDRRASARRRRTLVGLGLLLVLQLALFAVSALTWQGLIDGRLVLPPLDRMVSLLSLIVVVWMWCLPDPAPTADGASALPALAVIVASITATRWWMEQPAQLTFNGTPWDWAASIFGLALVGLGGLYLLARRPAGYAYGLAMLGVEGAGLALHLALLPYGEDFPSAFRLAQMIAYPMLGLLPLRILPAEDEVRTGTAAPEMPAASIPEGLDRYADPRLWAALARVAGENDPERAAREIGLALSEAFDADLCALLGSPDSDGGFPVRLAYDRGRRRLIEVDTLEARRHPVLTSAWRNSRARRLSVNGASGHAAEVAAAAAALEQAQPGSLLFQPVASPDGSPAAAVVLLSSDAAKDWRSTEQELLALLARPMAQFLQHCREMLALKEDLTRTRSLVRIAQDSAKVAIEDKSKLQGRLAVAHENAERDRHHILELTAIAAAKASAETLAARLGDENQALVEAARQAEKTLGEIRSAHAGELRLALQEIDLLQAAVNESEERLARLKIDPANTSKARQQMESVAAIAKDLRGPLGSIGSYADVLLSETAGIVSEKQRKYLERIKVSSARMGRLIDELLQAAAPESSPGRYDAESFDLVELVRKAAVDAEPRLRRRQIALKLDLPNPPLTLVSDRHALRKITLRLLENAILASPEGGAVIIRLRLEGSDKKDENYALLQVSDSGGGINPSDSQRLFSALDAPPQAGSADHAADGVTAAAIPGLGLEVAEFPPLRSLVEAIGGRVWVDSEAQRGAMFSVLLRAGVVMPPTPAAGTPGEPQPDEPDAAQLVDPQPRPINENEAFAEAGLEPLTPGEPPPGWPAGVAWPVEPGVDPQWSGQPWLDGESTSLEQNPGSQPGNGRRSGLSQPGSTSPEVSPASGREEEA